MIKRLIIVIVFIPSVVILFFINPLFMLLAYIRNGEELSRTSLFTWFFDLIDKHSA